MVRRMSDARHRRHRPGARCRRSTRPDTSRWAVITRGRPPSKSWRALLDAVLALALAVGEADQPGGQGRARGAALRSGRPAPAGARGRSTRGVAQGRGPRWRHARHRSAGAAQGAEEDARTRPPRSRVWWSWSADAASSSRIGRAPSPRAHGRRGRCGPDRPPAGRGRSSWPGRRCRCGRRCHRVPRLGDRAFELGHGVDPHLRAAHDLPVGQTRCRAVRRAARSR
mgnify:CR=1 FL=1